HEPLESRLVTLEAGIRSARSIFWIARPTCRRLLPRGHDPASPWYRRPVDSGWSMAETADDLSTPLGQATAARGSRRYRLPFTAAQAFAALLGLFLAGFAGFAVFNNNPLGGEPIARLEIPSTALTGQKAVAPASEPSDAVK